MFWSMIRGIPMKIAPPLFSNPVLTRGCNFHNFRPKTHLFFRPAAGSDKHKLHFERFRTSSFDLSKIKYIFHFQLFFSEKYRNTTRNHSKMIICDCCPPQARKFWGFTIPKHDFPYGKQRFRLIFAKFFPAGSRVI